jgi:hypothetical protein
MGSFNGGRASEVVIKHRVYVVDRKVNKCGDMEENKLSYEVMI